MRDSDGLAVASRCVLPGLALQTGLPGPERAPRSRELATLPPAPNSLALVLSALLAVGAYQGSRSLARLGAATLPEWYHTGAPAQVGHVRAYDFGASYDEPVFTAAVPIALTLERVQLDDRSPPGIPFTPTRAPRSPPSPATRA